MKHNITALTSEYLAKREAVETAEKALAQAEALLKQSFAQNGVDFNIVNGKKVSLVKSIRNTYNAEALKGLISDRLFKKVTKVAVDGTKFKSAVALGDIKHDVAGAVTTETEVEAIRVYEVDAEGAEVKKSRDKKVA